jgi:hypothetical protein
LIEKTGRFYVAHIRTGSLLEKSNPKYIEVFGNLPVVSDLNENTF